MFKHCHFHKPKKRVTKKIIKVTIIKFKPKVKHHHRKHRHHDCHRHHKFW